MNPCLKEERSRVLELEMAGDGVMLKVIMPCLPCPAHAHLSVPLSPWKRTPHGPESKCWGRTPCGTKMQVSWEGLQGEKCVHMATGVASSGVWSCLPRPRSCPTKSVPFCLGEGMAENYQLIETETDDVLCMAQKCVHRQQHATSAAQNKKRRRGRREYVHIYSQSPVKFEGTMRSLSTHACLREMGGIERQERKRGGGEMLENRDMPSSPLLPSMPKRHVFGSERRSRGRKARQNAEENMRVLIRDVCLPCLSPAFFLSCLVFLSSCHAKSFHVPKSPLSVLLTTSHVCLQI